MFIPSYKLHHGPNMDILKGMADNSLDAIVTDCPYGLGKEPDAVETLQAWITTGYHEIKGAGFMGKKWDSFVPQPLFWKEVYRVLKPGGYVLAFFGTRTYDWGTMAIRLAGFQIRDCIQWIYGSGFPKSLDVSKAIDKAGPMGQTPFAEFASHYEERRKAKGLTHAAVCKAGGFYGNVNHGGSSVNWANGYALPTFDQWLILQPLLDLDEKWKEGVEREQYEREVIGKKDGNLLAVAPGQENDRSKKTFDVTAPGSEDAETWEGYGTALKPANEPICVARKPLDGTVANNVITHGCGAINLDGCRIDYQSEDDKAESTNKNQHPNFGSGARDNKIFGSDPTDRENYEAAGRFPANVIFDEEAAAVLDQQSGTTKSGKKGGVYGTFDQKEINSIYGAGLNSATPNGEPYGDTGGASRFFYCAKASKEDRNYGCEGLALKDPACVTDFRPSLKSNPENWTNGTEGPHMRTTPKANNHPTVKPIALMRYLVRLVKTPFETCTVGDFFMGSGTTGVACMLEGINFVGCDEDENSHVISSARVPYAQLDFEKQQKQPKQAEIFTKPEVKKTGSIVQTFF